jgi:hypothetical protein
MKRIEVNGVHWRLPPPKTAQTAGRYRPKILDLPLNDKASSDCWYRGASCTRRLIDRPAGQYYSIVELRLPAPKRRHSVVDWVSLSWSLRLHRAPHDSPPNSWNLTGAELLHKRSRRLDGPPAAVPEFDKGPGRCTGHRDQSAPESRGRPIDGKDDRRGYEAGLWQATTAPVERLLTHQSCHTWCRRVTSTADRLTCRVT